MPGAGSGALVMGRETEPLGTLVETDGSPDLFQIGRDDSVDEFQINNQLIDLSKGDSVFDVESVGGNYQGQVTVSANVSADVHGDIEQIVFNDGGTGIVQGQANTARAFIDSQYLGGTEDLELIGATPTEYSIEYQQGETVGYTLTLSFADLEPSPTTDLSTATEASAGSTVVWHGFDLQIDAGGIENLQSATFSISEIARLIYGASKTANNAVIASPTPTLEATATFTEPNLIDIAKGGADAVPSDDLQSSPATIDLTSSGGTAVSTYDLEQVTPDTGSLGELLSAENTTESATFNVTGRDAVTVS